MKKLLVGSIYANDSVDQQRWLDLQLKYLQATTVDFEHVAIIMGHPTNQFFADNTDVIYLKTDLQESIAHMHGLKFLKTFFVDKQKAYENFLFLDSDAFPIKMNWQELLLKAITPEICFEPNGMAIPSKSSITYDIASIVRSENLERRLHASVLFCRGSKLCHLNFAIDVVGNDMVGNLERDIFLPEYQQTKRSLAFPLIRTNQTNVHPLACGIYYDMFYHHCCGSGRNFEYRSKKYHRYVSDNDNLHTMTTQLFQHPTEFVNRLAGWTESKYPKTLDRD